MTTKKLHTLTDEEAADVNAEPDFAAQQRFVESLKSMSAKPMSTNIEETKKELIDWMNYGIPKGKTIPVFEDLLQAYATARDEEVLWEMVRLGSENIENNGAIEFHDALLKVTTFMTNRNT